MNAVAAEKFENFEWLTKGITAKSPQFGDEGHGTSEKPIDYQDRLGAIAAMNSQLAKSITSIIIFGNASKGDYEFVRNHLAKLMMDEAQKDKKREPEHVAIYHLSWLVARLVIDFAINPELEGDYTAKGRLSYMGLKSYQMGVEQYRKTWKPYENLMSLALESAIDEASNTIIKYKKETYRS
jgi:hypothetical protein